MKRFAPIAIMLALTGLMLAGPGCVDKDKEKNMSQAEVEKIVEQFPNRDIHLICPPKQGGLSDFITRTLGAFSEEQMGAKIIVENRPGAAGAVGMRFGASAKPDGYTVTYVTVESAIFKHRKDIEETVSYEDFDLLARLNYGPASITVNDNSPFRTFDELIEYAKANPGAIKIGTSGQFSIWHLAAATMASELGLKVGFVPYDGAAPSIQDLLGGHLDAVVASPSETYTFVKAGQLRMLAVFGQNREEDFPDVPTAIELGHDIDVGAWGGLGAPKGTPDEIKAYLTEKFKAGFDSQEFKDKCKERGLPLAWLDAADFRAFAEKQDKAFGKALSTLEME